MCLNELTSVHDVPEPLSRPKTDITMYLPFDYVDTSSTDHLGRGEDLPTSQTPVTQELLTLNSVKYD